MWLKAKETEAAGICAIIEVQKFQSPMTCFLSRPLTKDKS